VQNFTANADVLRAAVSGIKNSAVDPNAAPADVPVTVASTGLSSLAMPRRILGRAACCWRCAAWRKIFAPSPAENGGAVSGGFPLTQENQSELTATIDACNNPNVAVYALDARGLVAKAPVER